MFNIYSGLDRYLFEYLSQYYKNFIAYHNDTNLEVNDTYFAQNLSPLYTRYTRTVFAISRVSSPY